MSEESKPVESQKDESKEHEQANETPAADIMAPETPQSVPIVNLVPAQKPVKPVVLAPPRPGSEPIACPECGWQPSAKTEDREQALKAHIRFKHTLPRARKEAADRKAGVAPSVNGEQPPPPDFSDIPDGPAQPAAPVLAPAKFEGMANMSFDMTTGLLARIFGNEWLPQPDADDQTKSTERATVVLAIQKYYESINLPDIPPGYMLCFVVLAYSAPRLAAQPTKTKLQSAWLRFKLFFSKKKGLEVSRPPQAIIHNTEAPNGSL